MPHIRLEYTANVAQPPAFGQLFLELHRTLNSVAGIDINNCKSRAVRLEEYLIAQAEDTKAFVHLDVSFLEGHSDEVRREIGARFLESARRSFATAIAGQDLQISVEIRDIDRKFYFKHPAGSIRVIR